MKGERWGLQRGFTFAELLGVLAISTLALTLSLAVSHNWIQRQAARSAVYEVQSHLQLARAHAITRNQACAFRIDEATRLVRIFDVADDIELNRITLSSTIRFERPDLGAPITLSPLPGTEWATFFTPRGHVSAGDGEIVIRGGDGYRRVVVYAAGGVGVERWDGSAWTME